MCIRFAVSLSRVVKVGPLGTAATTGPLYQPQMTDDDECGAIGGTQISKKKQKYSKKKPVRMTLCQPQIPRDLTHARTRAAAVGSRPLTA
jgi:hypothetical protein